MARDPYCFNNMPLKPIVTKKMAVAQISSTDNRATRYVLINLVHHKHLQRDKAMEEFFLEALFHVIRRHSTKTQLSPRLQNDAHWKDSGPLCKSNGKLCAINTKNISAQFKNNAKRNRNTQSALSKIPTRSMWKPYPSLRQCHLTKRSAK